MKQLITIFFIILCSLTLTAQEKWGSMEGSIAGPNPLIVEVCGDTVVAGKTYEKLYVTYFGFTQLEAGRRIQNDSVFIRYFNSSQETLLYDYSMTVGDSISNSWGTYEVVAVELSGRKKLTLEETTYGVIDIWIEDIGSIVSGYLTDGVHHNVFDSGSEFSCYYNGGTGELFHGNSNPSDCKIDFESMPCNNTSTTKDSKNLSTQVYPNPASDYLYINLSTSEEKNSSCVIYDLAGNKVLTYNLANSVNQLPVHHLVEGLYIVNIGSENSYAVQKVWIN